MFFGNIPGTIFSEVVAFWNIAANEKIGNRKIQRNRVLKTKASPALHMRNIVLSFSELRKLSSLFTWNFYVYLLWPKSMQCAMLMSVLIHLIWLSDLRILIEVSFSKQDKLHSVLFAWKDSLLRSRYLGRHGCEGDYWKDSLAKLVYEVEIFREFNSTCSIYRL